MGHPEKRRRAAPQKPSGRQERAALLQKNESRALTKNILRRGLELDLGEGVVEVGDEVFDVFDADGEADQPVGDADLLANVGGNGGVSHRRGMRDEGLDAAEAFGEGAKFHVIEQVAGRIEAADVEREHGAEAALLFFGDGVLRMRREAGIDDALHFGMGFEEFGHGHAV